MSASVPRAIALIAAVVLSVAADCCDPQHDAKQDKSKADLKDAQLCRDRGGIPATELGQDDGGHAITRLIRCDFPPAPAKLSGESK